MGPHEEIRSRLHGIDGYPQFSYHVLMQKACSRCKVVKGVEFFYPRKDQPGKYTSQCAACRYEVKAQRTLELYGPRTRGRKSTKTADERAEAARAYRREYKKKQRQKRALERPSKPPKLSPEEVRRRDLLRMELKRRSLGIKPREWLDPAEAIARAKARKAAARRNRKARQRDAIGSHTDKDIARIHAAQKYKCAICKTGTKVEKHVDHIIPLASGGSNGPENLQILCPACNMQKAAKDPIEFMQQLGRLL